MDKILLIDGLNSIWRACVKFGNAQSNISDEVIFTFNFFRNLRPIIEKFSPNKCFFVLEGRPQFRYDLYPDYKANRITKLGAISLDDNDKIIKKKKNVETFHKTKKIIISLIQYLPITICKASNYEADDVISTLVDNMKGEDITIISSDSDYIQILQRGYSNVRIYNPIKKQFIKAPSYPYVAWKCLAGDVSDNIKKLLTPKKAEAAMNNPKIFEEFLKIDENRANFNINRQLIEFQSFPLEDLEIIDGIRNFDKLRDEFSNMQFESIINEKSWQKYCDTFDCIKF